MGVLMQELERVRTSRLGANATWMMIGQGVSVVMQAVYFAILARLLGAADYGIFAGAFAFTSLVAQYSTLGSGTVMLRYVSGHRAAFAVYWGNILVITTVVGGLMVLGLSLIGRYILNPASASLVVFAAIANCICFQLTTEMGRVFQTFERMRITAIVNMLTNLVRALTAGAMLVVMHRASAREWAIAFTLVSILAAGVAVGCVTASFGRPRIFPMMFPKHGWEGIGYAFAGSTSSVYNDLDKTMLSHYDLNHANGIYTVAYRVIDIASMPIYSIRDAAMPRLFERGRTSIHAAADLSYKLLKRSVPIGAVLSLGTFLVAPLLPHIVGSSFTESAHALRWLALIPLFRSIHQMAGSAMTGAGKQQYRTIAQLSVAGLNFLLNLYLIPTFGWVGAAQSSLITDATLSALNLILLQVCIRKAAPNPSSRCVD
jgi:O-antigen/teichoic acid export membrane protein